MPDPSIFYVRGDDGQEYGPVEMDELRGWVAENRAGLGTSVRYDQPGALWQPWQYYPELVAMLAEIRAGAGGPLLVIAPMGRRILALILDLVLFTLLILPVSFVVMELYMPNWGDEFMQMMQAQLLQSNAVTPPEFYHHAMILNLVSSVGLILYMAGFNAAHGKTPAKAILRLRVVDSLGHRPTPLKALLRAMVLLVSLNFYIFYIPLICAFLNPQRRALHDWVAGTLVVEA
jgi:uncharacterized RDD family membrane protein YckC